MESKPAYLPAPGSFPSGFISDYRRQLTDIDAQIEVLEREKRRVMDQALDVILESLAVRFMVLLPDTEITPSNVEALTRGGQMRYPVGDTHMAYNCYTDGTLRENPLGELLHTDRGLQAWILCKNMQGEIKSFMADGKDTEISQCTEIMQKLLDSLKYCERILNTNINCKGDEVAELFCENLRLLCEQEAFDLTQLQIEEQDMDEDQENSTLARRSIPESLRERVRSGENLLPETPLTPDEVLAIFQGGKGSPWCDLIHAVYSYEGEVEGIDWHNIHKTNLFFPPMCKYTFSGQKESSRKLTEIRNAFGLFCRILRK